MQYFDLVLSFTALFGLCAFLTLKARLHSALAPLAALGITGIWFTLAGVADLLVAGGWVFYLAAWGLGIFALVTKRSEARRLLSPGAVVFWGLAVSFAVYFSVRQPMFHNFDEFSFWGPAAQMTSTTNHLYTICEYGTPWQATQNCGLLVLSYFVQFFGAFAPFKVYLAYNLLLFACIAALVGVIGFKHYRLALPMAVIGWCTPWFFTVYARTVAVNDTYMSAYGDIPAGMLAGGAVAMWLALRSEKSAGPRWAVLPVLALMANIKDNTFPIALIAAGCIAADAFLFDYKDRWKEGLARRFGFAVLCLAVPLAQYKVWSSYIAILVQKNAESGGSGVTSLSPFGAALQGTKMLLGLSVPEEYAARQEQFFAAIRNMWAAFLSKERLVSMVGQGVLVTGLILGMFVIALVFAKGMRQRLRVLCWMGLSTLGFAAYSYVITISYGFIFKDFQAVVLDAYNRYMYTYYIAWFVIAAAVLAWVVQTGRWRLLGQAGALAFACLMLLRVNMMVLPQMSVLGFSDATFADQYLIMEKVDAVKAQIDEDDRIFFVSQGDDGLLWFTYSCYFQPNILDYSGWELDEETGLYGAGGGTFCLPENMPEVKEGGALYFHAYSTEDFAKAVAESGCEYIFVEKLDAGFVAAYGSLFTDGLAAAENGETLLYRIAPGGYEPVAMEVPR
ncbi:MAG: hypothetical protein SOY27_04875 [Fournierella sp.]|uniref:hypothetical protein n=1 Tax=Allofournierella sp. TaxID=1940256 RepID=UPI002A8170FC|nr:hypothetical protein [Fournierella sp.]MDY4166808.1 hypothetical protein [Fournierella sp.]